MGSPDQSRPWRAFDGAVCSKTDRARKDVGASPGQGRDKRGCSFAQRDEDTDGVQLAALAVKSPPLAPP